MSKARHHLERLLLVAELAGIVSVGLVWLADPPTAAELFVASALALSYVIGTRRPATRR